MEAFYRYPSSWIIGTTTYGNVRLITSVIVFILSGTVLGLSANFAKLSLSGQNDPLVIFSIVVPSLTILLFLIFTQWTQPQIEVPSDVIFLVLWIALASWISDVIGHIECFSLTNATIHGLHGDLSERTYCYQMRIIQAFAWIASFVFGAALALLVALTTRTQVMGNRYVWSEDTRYLPWFNEYPGYQRYPMYQQQNYQQQIYQPGMAQNFVRPIVV